MSDVSDEMFNTVSGRPSPSHVRLFALSRLNDAGVVGIVGRFAHGLVMLVRIAKPNLKDLDHRSEDGRQR